MNSLLMVPLLNAAFCVLQVREETADTRLTIVSAGYFVRLLTSTLTSLAGYTHLVIDEVQQRSTDIDIICLLAKKVSYSACTF